MRKVYLCLVFILLFEAAVYAYRISRPAVFTLPWTQDQINRLNKALLDLWYLQQGEFNLDVVTASKTNAQNGDIWLIYTPPVVRIQYKAQDHVYTMAKPQGF